MAEKNFLQDREAPVRKQIPAKYFNEDESSRPASVLISKPVSEVWAFIRDLSNMPKFIRGLSRVEMIDETHSRWVFDHKGEHLENDSVIINEEPESLLVWRATTGHPHVGAISLEEAPGGRGTFVSMRTSRDSQHGKVTGVLSWYFGGDPKSASYVNLRRLKAYMETGEVPTVEGQSNGREQELTH